jgi:4-amino-4-deoxy-L-arabinose transferase-like glycosyltransferase
MSRRLHRLLLLLILAVYAILAVGYGLVTPLFEAPDEHLHYFTADFIAREGRIPKIGDPGRMGQEAAQPPLYYVLGALLVRTAGAHAIEQPLWHNPQADPEDPRGESRATPPLNVNMFVHGPVEAWPWQGYALAAHLIRLLSALFGLGTLLCIFGAGRVVWPLAPGRALLATALVAFLPQFAFLHGAVSNDPAIIFFSAAAIYQLLRVTTPVVRRDDERRVTSKEPAARVDSLLVTRHSSLVTYLLLGLTIGLAMLSKAAGLLLLVYSAAVVAAVVWRAGGARRWGRAAGAAALVAGPALLLGGWLLWRNWALYGDPTAANQFFLMAGGERTYTLLQVWGDMDRIWTSLFARFGWMNLRPPAWIWGVWSAIAVAAVAGGLWGVFAGLRRSPRPRFKLFDLLLHPAVLLLGWFLLVAAAWLQFMLRTPADQGRLFFPALIPLALGAAYGLSRWPRPWTQLAAVAAALLTTVYCLAVVVPAAYAPSPVVDGLPDDVIPLGITFPEGLELVGARVETPAVAVGDWAWLTLYWRATEALSPGAPLAHLELFGRGFHRIGLQTGYHGRGNDPATLWPPGAIVADRMAVRVLDDTIAPVEARLTVKLDEAARGSDMATVKIVPVAWPPPAAPLATLGEGIELTRAELAPPTAAPGETVEARLGWQVTAPPGPELLHVFVHLGDPAQPPLAQFDGPVMSGEYPARLWQAGERFDEEVTLVLPADLPPGEYPVTVGLYDYASGARLPLTVDGQRQPNDAYTVGQLVVR